MLEKDLTQVVERVDVPHHIDNIKEYLSWLNPNFTKITTKDFKEAFRYTLLKDLDFPSDLVFFTHKPKFINADTYITYIILSENREEYAGDIAKAIAWKVQVNIYTKEDYDYDDLKEQIIENLENADMICYDSQELYLDDLEMFHIPIKFKYKMLK